MVPSEERMVLPKPVHLGPEFASQFTDPSVVAAYHHRPPYPAEVFEILSGLVVPPGMVLDVGTGTGEIARGLVGRVAGVDALDPSAGMLAEGRRLPGGEHPQLSWIQGAAEDAALHPPYGLITAAASLHWMEWAIVLPRFRELLAPGGVLAIVEQHQAETPWDAALSEVVAAFSTNRAYRPYDLVNELVRRSLFRERGRRVTAPIVFTQPLEAYIASFHARNGFSRDRMTPDAAAAFDRTVADLVRSYTAGGDVELQITGQVVWGLPAPVTECSRGAGGR